jgi:hypothetical protein
MPHLIGDVAEGVWKNSLLSKVIRLGTGKELEFFDLVRWILRPRDIEDPRDRSLGVLPHAGGRSS